jgi:hypothetical protein
MNFAASVDQFATKTKTKIERVFTEAAVAVVDNMQTIGISLAYPSGQGGYLPVDTGWLQNSIRVSFVSMPQIDPNSFPPEGAGSGLGLHLIRWNEEITFAEIRAAEIGQTIFVGYTAAYAAYQEYASPSIKGFVRKAAQRWPQIVEQIAARYGSEAPALSLTAHR